MSTGFEALIDNGLTVLGLVVDRAHLPDAKAFLTCLESRPDNLRGWTVGIHRFESNPEYKFLFMIAENQQRVIQARPVIGRLDTLKELTNAAHYWGDKTNGRKSLWLVMLGGKPYERVTKILADTGKAKINMIGVTANV